MNENGEILVVDDEADFRQSLSDILEATGYRVNQAEDGQKGVDKVAGQRHKLVIMDIRMPRKDGISALQDIKKLRPELPVMMVSAFRPDAKEMPLVKTHAAGLYSKPLDMGRFISAVQQLCPPPHFPLP